MPYTHRYNSGLDILGERGLLIKVKNVPELVRKQGGLATVAQALAPNAIEEKVYSEMAKKINAGFRDQGVVADLSVVETGGYPPAQSTFLRNVAIGLGAVVIGGGAYLYLRKK